jgi:hypothetical protein
MASSNIGLTTSRPWPESETTTKLQGDPTEVDRSEGVGSWSKARPGSFDSHGKGENKPYVEEDTLERHEIGQAGTDSFWVADKQTGLGAMGAVPAKSFAQSPVAAQSANYYRRSDQGAVDVKDEGLQTDAEKVQLRSVVLQGSQILGQRVWKTMKILASKAQQAWSRDRAASGSPSRMGRSPSGQDRTPARESTSPASKKMDRMRKSPSSRASRSPTSILSENERETNLSLRQQ